MPNWVLACYVLQGGGMSVTRRALLLRLIGIVTILLPFESEARRGRGVRVNGRGLRAGAKHSGPVLTRDQLRQCIKEQNNINAQNEAVNKMQVALGESEAKINNLERRIAAMKPHVDVYNQKSVDSFNKLINEHKQFVNAYNSKLPTINAHLDDINSAVDRFNKSCAEHAYYEHDMAAVLDGK